MPTIFQPPRAFIPNASGVKYPGAKAYFFQTGTTTPKNSYTDFALSVAHAHPVVANANGDWDTIYLANDARYRVTLKQSDGTLIYTQDDVGGPVLTQSEWGGIGYPKTAAETSAGVTPTNYAYEPGNILRYGGNGNGSTDNAAALTSAVAVAAVNGTTIFFPEGTYAFSSHPSLDNKQGIIFQGVVPTNSGAARGAVLKYTGTTSPAVSALNAQGVEWRDLQFIHSNAGFSGTYIKFGGTAALVGASNCLFGANVGSGVTHFDLDATLLFTAYKCVFFHGGPSIKGQAFGGGSFSNVVTFRDCEWYYNETIPIKYGGESWNFDGCTFEPLTTLAAGAFDSGAVNSIGMRYVGCWFGDVSVAGGTWISVRAKGLEISGCRFAGEVTNTNAVGLTSCNGVSIHGNSFDTFPVVINFYTGNDGVSVDENYFTNCTAAFGNTANIGANVSFKNNSPNIAEIRSFTATLDGMDGGGTITGGVWYTVADHVVRLHTSAGVTGTSAAATMTLTGLPAAITPTHSQYVACTGLTDNGSLVSGIAQVKSDNTIVFGNGITNYAGNGFTASGTKGLGAGCVLSYAL